MGLEHKKRSGTTVPGGGYIDLTRMCRFNRGIDRVGIKISSGVSARFTGKAKAKQNGGPGDRNPKRRKRGSGTKKELGFCGKRRAYAPKRKVLKLSKDEKKNINFKKNRGNRSNASNRRGAASDHGNGHKTADPGRTSG